MVTRTGKAESRVAPGLDRARGLPAARCRRHARQIKLYSYQVGIAGAISDRPIPRVPVAGGASPHSSKKTRRRVGGFRLRWVCSRFEWFSPAPDDCPGTSRQIRSAAASMRVSARSTASSSQFRSSGSHVAREPSEANSTRICSRTIERAARSSHFSTFSGRGGNSASLGSSSRRPARNRAIR
jgi:hypothetical protein